MRRRDLLIQRLVAVALFALPCLTFPLLGLADGAWFGWPAGYLYLFAVWAALIGVAAWLAEHRER